MVSFTQRFGVTAISRVVATSLQLVSFVILARRFEVSEFGVYALFSVLTQVYFSIFDFGGQTIHSRGVLHLSDYDRLGSFLRLRLCSSVLGFLLVVTYAMTWSPDFLFLILLGFSFTAVETLGDFGVVLNQSLRKTGMASVFLVCRKAFSLLAIMLLPDVIQGLLIGLLSSLCISLASIALHFKNRTSRRMSIRQLMSEGRGFLMSGLSGNISQLDVLVVGLALGPTGSGLYSPATRVSNAVTVLASSFWQVLIPDMNQLAEKSEKLLYFKRIRRKVVQIVFLLFIVAPLSPIAFLSIFGNKYTNSSPVVVASIMAVALSLIAQLYLSYFASIGKLPKRLPELLLASVGFGLLLIFLLSYQFGICGSAIGLLLMHILVATVVVAFSEAEMSRSAR